MKNKSIIIKRGILSKFISGSISNLKITRNNVIMLAKDTVKKRNKSSL